jgi:broad specificity phosphatase PhoE
MPPTIHLVCDAHYNDDPICQDPGLDRYGVHQCVQLAASFEHHDKIQFIFTSPLSRAVETALEAFPSFAQRGAITPVPLLAEFVVFESDVGHHRCVLKYRFSEQDLDYSHVWEEDWHDQRRQSLSPQQFAELRGAEIRAWLRSVAKPFSYTDIHIVVVTHQHLLSLITENIPGHLHFFRHGELRSYQFIDLYSDDYNAEMFDIAVGPPLPPSLSPIPEEDGSFDEEKQQQQQEEAEQGDSGDGIDFRPWMRQCAKKKLKKYSAAVAAPSKEDQGLPEFVPSLVDPSSEFTHLSPHHPIPVPSSVEHIEDSSSTMPLSSSVQGHPRSPEFGSQATTADQSGTEKDQILIASSSPGKK